MPVRCTQKLICPKGQLKELSAVYARFPVVLSLEFVEHVYDPRKYAATIFSLVESGGTAIISAPYHGYWKNLVVALSGKMDSHLTALWDHGQTKFWSIKLLSAQRSGFSGHSVRAGRTCARFLQNR